MLRRLVGAATALLALAALLAVPVAGAQLPLLTIATAVAVGVGGEVLARLHPSFGPPSGRLLACFWTGPSLTVLALSLAVSQAEPTLGRALGLAGGVLVGLMLLVQEHELAGNGEGRLFALSYAVVLYLAAFTLFVALYSLREQVWLGALGVGLATALTGLALYRPSGAPIGRAWLFAGLTGLCAAEMALAAGFWMSGGLLGGAFLLLFFYVAAGLVQSHLEGSLTARLVAEYTVVGALGLGLIIWSSPWRG